VLLGWLFVEDVGLHFALGGVEMPQGPRPPSTAMWLVVIAEAERGVADTLGLPPIGPAIRAADHDVLATLEHRDRDGIGDGRIPRHTMLSGPGARSAV